MNQKLDKKYVQKYNGSGHWGGGVLKVDPKGGSTQSRVTRRGSRVEGDWGAQEKRETALKQIFGGVTSGEVPLAEEKLKEKGKKEER